MREREKRLERDVGEMINRDDEDEIFFLCRRFYIKPKELMIA